MEIRPMTKDTYKVMTAIYGKYLEKCDIGNSSKQQCKSFEEFEKIEIYQGWLHEDDFEHSLSELEKIDFLTSDIAGGFVINDNLIIFMENKLKKGLSDVKDILSGVLDVLSIFRL